MPPRGELLLAAMSIRKRVEQSRKDLIESGYVCFLYSSRRVYSCSYLYIFVALFCSRDTSRIARGGVSACVARPASLGLVQYRGSVAGAGVRASAAQLWKQHVSPAALAPAVVDSIAAIA